MFTELGTGTRLTVALSAGLETDGHLVYMLPSIPQETTLHTQNCGEHSSPEQQRSQDNS